MPGFQRFNFGRGKKAGMTVRAALFMRRGIHQDRARAENRAFRRLGGLLKKFAKQDHGLRGRRKKRFIKQWEEHVPDVTASLPGETPFQRSREFSRQPGKLRNAIIWAVTEFRDLTLWVGVPQYVKSIVPTVLAFGGRVTKVRRNPSSKQVKRFSYYVAARPGMHNTAEAAAGVFKPVSTMARKPRKSKTMSSAGGRKAAIDKIFKDMNIQIFPDPPAWVQQRGGRSRRSFGVKVTLK
jgi:hypothetical protein